MQEKYPFIWRDEQLGEFIYQMFILPAYARGERQAAVHVLNIWRTLHFAESVDFIRAVLGSTGFKETYGLALSETYRNTYVFNLQGDGAACDLPGCERKLPARPSRSCAVERTKRSPSRRKI